MAPEQLVAFLDETRWDSVGPTADLYAVGLILTELLTGRRPEVPDPELPLPRAISELIDKRSAPRRSLHDANPGIPHALDAVIARCLKMCPEKRYPDATALAEDLEAIADGTPLVHTKNTSLVETSLEWLFRKRVKLAAGLAVAASLAFLAFVIRPYVAAQYLREGEVANESARYREAADKLRVAEWLSPDDPAVESALGQVDFGEKRYERSHARFTRAMKLAAAPSGRLSDWQTACLLYRRSQTDLDWAVALQGREGPFPQSTRSPQPLGSEFIVERILEALNDLRQAELLVKTDRALLYRIGMGKMRVEFYLGEIASARNDHAAALEHYVNARALAGYLLKSTLPRHPQATVWQLDVERSAEVIRRHLQDESPSKLGLESAAVGPESPG